MLQTSKKSFKVGIWALTLPGRKFTVDPEIVGYLKRLATEFLEETDFKLVIPIGAADFFNELEARFAERLHLVREPYQPHRWSLSSWWTGNSTMAAKALDTRPDIWICPGIAFRQSANGLPGIDQKRLNEEFTVFTPENGPTVAVAVKSIGEALSKFRGSSDNPLHWNDEKTKILRMFKRSLASGSEGTGSKRLPGKPRIRLLLGSTYRGGVWELVRNLISELVDLNNRIGSIDLSLLVTPEQDLAGLNVNSKDLDVGRIQLQILPVHQVAWEFGDSFFPASKGRQLYAWPEDSRKDSIQPDAIFAMVDRFNLPMPPRVPFGVWIYDMIQEKFPEGFPKAFFEIYEEAMKPTVALAQVAVVPSEPVMREAESAYKISPEKLVRIPVACQPGLRFANLTPTSIPEINKPFYLYPANASPHKGAELVIRAVAMLRELVSEPPMVIQCGFMSDAFSSRNGDSIDNPHSNSIRKLVQHFGLVEGRDILFLGTVSDSELKWLYERAVAVINAARFDNGSFNMIEGHWFGRPVISTDYPSARELAERFKLPVRFVPLDDGEGLARELASAIHVEPLSSAALDGVRADLNDPEYSTKRQAERFLEVLTRLGHMATRANCENSN